MMQLGINDTIEGKCVGHGRVPGWTVGGSSHACGATKLAALEKITTQKRSEKKEKSIQDQFKSNIPGATDCASCQTVSIANGTEQQRKKKYIYIYIYIYIYDDQLLLFLSIVAKCSPCVSELVL
jgi:hypothetical protein